MEIFKDETRSFEERAVDLVSKMTLEEKIGELGNQSAAIPRLGIPHYNYWSEASHGFFGPFKFHEMNVTSYPVCLAMSQSWDEGMVKKVASAISDECRAYYNVDGEELYFWCPTVNLARDPRNGRSDENFGEDPYLASKMAAAYVQGMQGDDPKYVKAVATPKHFALNSSENNRHRGSSNVDEATMREYYTKPFEAAVREGKAQSIMTSYNRINGVPASCNDMLLTTLLREEWGFDGFVVSDCGAVGDVYESPNFGGVDKNGRKLSGHYYAKNMKEASVMTLQAGTDMSCGTEHKYNLLQAVQEGLISEDTLDRALVRIFTTRFRLGIFDEKDSYQYLDKSFICSDEMKKLAVDIANDSIVLLKNEKNLLPIDKNENKTILVVGPNAIYRELGGYSAGSISRLVDTVVNVTPLQGIMEEVEGSNMQVQFEKAWCTDKEVKLGGPAALLPGVGPSDGGIMSGVDEATIQAMMADFLGPKVTFKEAMGAFLAPERFLPEDKDKQAEPEALFERALEAAKKADYVIVIAGTDATNASEENDRETLELPYGQNEKILKLLEANENTVVVLNTLGAVTGSFFEKAHTVVNAHFAGQAQGTAIANVLFGKINPSGKLTATWYRSAEDLPALNDYGIYPNDTMNYKGRTYMYFEGDVLFPFGYGQSYTEYSYSNMKIEKALLDANETMIVSVDVTNSGKVDGSEIVQLYIRKLLPENVHDKKPARQLKGYKKVALLAGETKTVRFELPVSEIVFWSNREKKMIVEPGEYMVEIGKNCEELPCTEKISITGKWRPELVTVYVDSDKYVLQKGETAYLHPVATLQDTSRIFLQEENTSYQSSDEQVATVNACGKVTAVGNGVTRIKVSVTYENKVLSRTVVIAVKE